MYDCPSANEVFLKDVGKMNIPQKSNDSLRQNVAYMRQ